MKATTHSRGGGFPETAWSVIAPGGDPARRAVALDKLIRRYWKPVYVFIRRGLHKSSPDAHDLTQEFFSTMAVDGPLLQKFVPHRGTFRAFLKLTVMSFVRDAARAAGREKRGGGTVSLPLHVATSMIDDGALRPDELFDRQWRQSVLERAVEILERRLRDGGFPETFDIFKRYELGPAAGDLSYEKVGKAVGKSAFAVKSHLERGREAFRRAVVEAVGEVVASEKDLAAELRQLFLE